MKHINIKQKLLELAVRLRHSSTDSCKSDAKIMQNVKIIENTLLLMAVDARWWTGRLYSNSVGTASSFNLDRRLVEGCRSKLSGVKCSEHTNEKAVGSKLSPLRTCSIQSFRRWLSLSLSGNAYIPNRSCESLRPHVTPFRHPGAQHDLPIFSTYKLSVRIDFTLRCSRSANYLSGKLAESLSVT